MNANIDDIGKINRRKPACIKSTIESTLELKRKLQFLSMMMIPVLKIVAYEKLIAC